MVAPETAAGVVLGTAVAGGVVLGTAVAGGVVPGTVVGADLEIVAVVVPGTVVAGVVPETAVVGEEAEGPLGTVVEEVDLETVVVADPGTAAAVEADSGTAAVVDIVVDLPPVQSSAVLTQKPQTRGRVPRKTKLLSCSILIF